MAGISGPEPAGLRQRSVPGPTPIALTEPFWQGCRDGRMLLQWCPDCKSHVFYPREICPHCWGTALQWREASGRAELRSFTEIHKPGHPAWSPVAPYVLALINLAEGPRMLTQLRDATPAQLRVGMELELALTPVGDFVLPFFKPFKPFKPFKEAR